MWIKTAWSRISRSASASWERFRTQIGQLPDNISSWFKKLPPVTWFDAKFPGWQGGVVAAIAAASLALVFNLVFLIVAMRRNKPASNGVGTILEGDCGKVGAWNQGSHAFINITSTLLLGLSNYCMQLLASPTRRSVDAAHERREWVDIGIPSFRNVWKKHIGPWQTVCWIILALSSAPLHLLWNSVIIFSPIAFSYNQLTVTEGFVHGLPFENDRPLRRDALEGFAHWPDNLRFLQQDLSTYEKLTSLECKRKYAQNFVRDRADVVVVTKAKTPQTETNASTVLGSIAGGLGPWPYQWLCPDELKHSFKCQGRLFQTDGWNLTDFDNPEVQYCLSQPMKQRCKLQYGKWITIFVITANFLKLLCFITTFFVVKHHTGNSESTEAEEKPVGGNELLITTGDAIASFLETPDNETLGMSIVEKEDFQNGIWKHRWVRVNPMLWRKRLPCSSFRAIGLRRWLTGSLLLSSIPVVPGIFLVSRLGWLRTEIQIDPRTITQLGIGNPHGLFLFGSWTGEAQLSAGGVLRNVALANIPQLVISIAYYIWNTYLTAIIAAREYDAYAAPDNGSDENPNKCSLRVTNPRKGSKQRPTHFLTIPFKYWVVSATLETGLHYLASQAVFYARVDLLDHWLEVMPAWSISQVGYSILGLIYFLVLAFLAFVFITWTSLRKLRNRTPLAATCSGAISAACHPHDPGVRHHEKEVHWGVEVEDSEEEFDEGERVKRCTITSAAAYYPKLDTYHA